MVREIIEVPAASAVDTGVPAWAQTGSIAVVLAVAVVALWRAASRGVERLWNEHSAALTRLQDGQAASIAKLAEGVHQVELAITRSDERNVAALAAIRETVTATVSRLDKHEERLDRVDGVLAEHGARLRVVEAR